MCVVPSIYEKLFKFQTVLIANTDGPPDDASGLQNAVNFAVPSLIFNPLNPDSNYANSDLDIRHTITAIRSSLQLLNWRV